MRGTCYISGKISGLDINLAAAHFMGAKIALLNYGYMVVNPMTLPHNHGKTWAEYMREDIIALMGCSHIYMLHNWQDSEGAKIEYELAEKLNIKIFFEIIE